MEDRNIEKIGSGKKPGDAERRRWVHGYFDLFAWRALWPENRSARSRSAPSPNLVVQIFGRDSNDRKQAPQPFAHRDVGARDTCRLNTVHRMRQIIYKIATVAEWQEAIAAGRYSGSADDVRDGFIHLSSRSQLPGTLEKHFRGKTDLVLIAFEEDKLGPGLKWETSRGGELFPHFYGPLPVASALWERGLDTGPAGALLIQDEWFTC